MALFALPFAAVGVIAGYFMVSQSLTWWSARSWVETPVTIEALDLESSTSDGSTTYEATATYRYVFLGQEYVSTKVGFGSGRDNIGDFHERVYSDLRHRRDSGEPVLAFVDPKNPERSVLVRELRWAMLLFQGVFFLLFGGVGFGLLAAVPVGMRKATEAHAFQDLHPNEPWKWDEKWRSPTIGSGGKSALIVPLVFASLWNAMSWGAVIAGREEFFDPAKREMLFILLFPFVGIFLAIWAVKAVLRYFRYGNSDLVLSTMPAQLGGRLVGSVLTSGQLARASAPGGAAATVKLSCTKIGHGKNSSNSVIWQDEQFVPSERLRHEQARTVIPFSMAIPREGRESSSPAGRRDITWALEVTADQPGVDFAASFEVPVFGVASESAASERVEEEFEPPRLSASDADWGARGVVITPFEGGHHYVFKRARQKMAALGMSVFGVIWTGTLTALWVMDAPMVVRIVFSLTELLVLWGLADMWLKRREIVANSSGLAWRSGFLRLGAAKTVPPSDVQKIHVEQGMQMGNTLYYRLRLEARGHKNRQVLGDKIKGPGRAKDLVARIERDLGIGS